MTITNLIMGASTAYLNTGKILFLDNSSAWATLTGDGSIGNPYVGNSQNKGSPSTGFVEFSVSQNANIFYNIEASSETNFDKIGVRKNGTFVSANISGTATANNIGSPISLTPSDVLKIQYAKDGSVSRLSDEGRIIYLYATLP
jgi:hypothetical protein